MVVNKGFSFSNIIGLYVYKPPIAHSKFKLIDDLGEISALYPGSVKQLYSQNSFEEGSIAYEFASVDETDTNAIVEFCSKYGLLFSERLDRNRRNDYMFSKKYRSLFSEEQPDYKPDAMPVSVFAREVITMRRFLAIKAALDNKDTVTVVNEVIRQLLSYTERTPLSLETETEMFNGQFYAYISRHTRIYRDSEEEVRNEYKKFDLVDMQNTVSQFISELHHYRTVKTDFEKSFYFGKASKYENIHHIVWQTICDLLTKIQTVTTIKSDLWGRTVYFEPELSKELLSKAEIDFDKVQILANACISDIMNSQTADICPELRYENGKLTADWHITSLLEAMYMELQVTFTPNTQIRKCANPTCNFFFDVGVGNNKKMYCSQRCALLMAKRKQRERDKQKKSK